MSGFSIDHGGAISVDPDALRTIARRIDLAATRCEVAAESLASAHRIIVDTPGFTEYVDTVALWAAGHGASRLFEECLETAESTMLMADAYEYVELKAQADALALTDAAAAHDLRLRMAEMAAADGRVPELAEKLVHEWEQRRFGGLEPPYPANMIFGPLVWAAALLGASPRFGTVRPGSTLSGKADAVTIAPVATSSPKAPPTSLAGSLNRMPSASGAQVAVEKYSYADGRTKFVAYIVGTQTASMGGTQPWDMKSNRELYTGSASASYQATVDALTAAGAQPGDEVDVVSHSQAGMIAAYLSTASEFEVKVQIAAGSPTQVMGGEGQTVVGLTHTDDPVAALSGGGLPGGAGAPDSFTVTREADPDAGPDYTVLGAHGLDAYIETAEMADASDDPRVEELGEFWDELSKAETIERTEYRAERVEESE